MGYFSISVSACLTNRDKSIIFPNNIDVRSVRRIKKRGMATIKERNIWRLGPNSKVCVVCIHILTGRVACKQALRTGTGRGREKGKGEGGRGKGEEQGA